MTDIGFGDSVDKIAKPSLNACISSNNTVAGSTAKGLVSVAVTKMAEGMLLISGVRLKDECVGRSIHLQRPTAQQLSCDPALTNLQSDKH